MGTWWASGALGMAAAAILISGGLTAAARPLARRVGLLDRPDARKKHKEPTPLLGGVAIYASFLAAYTLGRWAGWKWLDAPPETQRVVHVLLACAGAFCLIGLYDDRFALRPRVKLLLQIAASLPYVFWGQSIGTVHVAHIGLELGWFGAAFTVFWLVACSNVVNLTDGLDGLAGTTGLIICLAIAGISTVMGLPAIAGLAVIYAGCLGGFLLHNWPPAKIFLGDSGSLQIGFVVGALAIESSSKRAAGFALAIPLVLISVPVFDTCMAIVRRKLSGRSIGDADRGHIHHCLQDRGLSRLQVLLTLSSLSLAMAAATFLAVWMQSDLWALCLCLGLLTVLVAGRIFGDRETRLVFRHVEALRQILVDTAGVLRTRLFLARLQSDEPAPSSDPWTEVASHVRRMGGLELEFVEWDEATGAVVSRVDWRRENVPPDAHAAVWQFRYSTPRSGSTRAEVAASGRTRERLRGQRLVDLFRLFDELCRHWTPERAAARQPTPTPVTIHVADRRAA